MTVRAIEFTGVRKVYQHFTLADLSLHLDPGQIMGLVGPNGAGKTTTIRLLMGLCRPDAGEIRVLGHAIPEDQVRAKWDIGFVSPDMSLFGNATLGWHLAFFQSIYPGWDDRYAGHLLQRFHLRADQGVKGFSAGERAKALLLLALARRPRLLVLDEPTAGLDPVARHEVLGELMAVLENHERSILISSHNTQDVEQISDQIAFLDRGRLVAQADKETFTEHWRRLHLDIAPDVVLPPAGAVAVVRSGRSAVVTTNAYAPALEAAYLSVGAVIRDVQRLTLEEIFLATVLHHRQERAE